MKLELICIGQTPLMRGLLLWFAEGPALESTEEKTILISILMVFNILMSFSLNPLHHNHHWPHFTVSLFKVVILLIFYLLIMRHHLLFASTHGPSGHLSFCRYLIPLTFFLRWVLLEILSGVTPRSESTLAIFLASTPQLGATLLSHRRWTFILQAENRQEDK